MKGKRIKMADTDYELPDIRFLLEFGCNTFVLEKENKKGLPISTPEEVDAAWRISNKIGTLLLAHEMLSEKDVKEREELERSMQNIKDFINENYTLLLRQLRELYRKTVFSSVEVGHTAEPKPKDSTKKNGFDMLCESVN